MKQLEDHSSSSIQDFKDDMPGIVGIAAWNIDETGKHVLSKMIDSVNHRPSSYTVTQHSTAFCDIAQVQLNATPLVYSEDGSSCGFMEGKIYGSELERSGLVELQNDTSINSHLAECLASYQMQGGSFVKELNGAFALFILDLRRGKLLIVNDRYGLRPVYYAESKNGFLFASEAKAIREHVPNKAINNKAIIEFCAFGEVLGDKTLFGDIKVLPPGSILTYACEERKLSIDTYWKAKYVPDYNQTEEEFVAQLVHSFTKAVNMRMDEGHHYGISLSGGLDSRAIVAAIAEDKWPRTTLFTFGPPNCSERAIAGRVAEKVGQEIHTIDIVPEMILEHARDEVYLSDGMDYVGVSYIVPVHESITSLVDVVLDGFGLDLTLGGSYLSNEILTANEEQLPRLLYQRARKMSDLQMKKLFRQSYHEMIEKDIYISFKAALEKTWQAHPGNHCDCFFMENHVRRGTLMGHVLLRTVIENAVPTYDYIFSDVIAKIPPEKRANHHLYRKFLVALSPTLARIPYDKTMVSASAPPLFWKFGKTFQHYKGAFKRELACAFPEKLSSLMNNRSYVDFDGWLRTERSWKAYFHDLLLGEDARSIMYFTPDYVRELLETHGTTRARLGRRNNAALILYLSSVEWSLRLFSGSKS